MSNYRPLSFNRILLSIGIFIYFTTINSVNTQSDRTDAARKNSNNASESMRSALSNSAAAVDLFGPLWFPRTFAIACCMGGRPVPEIDDPKLISNWSTVVDDDSPPPAPSGRLTIDRMRLRTAVGGSGGAFDLGSLMSGGDGADIDQDRCIRYKGKYLLSAAALLSSINGGGSGGSGGLGVRCECPDTTAGVGSRLDRNCHYLPACANNGYRAFSINLRCACPEPYFGDTCEKFCDQGQRLKGIDGRDYCSCLPFYQGDECRDMICLNGGTEVKGRCLCASNYLGYHCEIDTNRTSGGGGVGGSGRFHRYDQSSDLFTRDISGTIFSLIMIIVLVVSMYLLMKHRMQVQQRYARRGDDYARSLPTSRRIGTDDLIDDAQILPYQQRSSAPGGGGPPPYMPIVVESIVSGGGTMRHHHQRSGGHHRGHELLPPLPTYEDATKLPPLVIAPVTANRSRRGAPRQHRSVATTATSADACCGSAQPVTRMTMTSSVSEQQPESSSSSSSTAIITPTTSSANTTKLIFTTMASTAIVPTIHRNCSSRRSV